MIVIDTSALIAIVKDESVATICREAMRQERIIAISAGTYVEALIVATRRDLEADMRDLLRAAIAEIIPVTPQRAALIADSYARWGKGVHPAGLNFGDCFAYAAAKEFGCPLLYIGNDFAKTDILSVITQPH